jgi:hypothetical protein
MTSKVFIFVFGTAVGVGIGAAVFSAKTTKSIAPAAETVSTNAATVNTAELESELASVKARLKQADQANDMLTARIQSLNQKAAAPTEPAAEETKKPKGLAALFGGDGTNGMSGAMNEMMKNAMAQQFEAKLAGMTSKLNLTAEQEAAIREIMEKQSARSLEMTQKMFKGELSADEMKDLNKDKPNEEDQIKALLTPEQTAAYDQFQTEEKTRMSRLAANAELMQMQSTLRLSEEQQDKVFAVLVDQAQSKNGNGPSDALDFRGKANKKAEALRSVLTPEQFERYQKFQDQQLKMIEAFMPKSPNNANATPVN